MNVKLALFIISFFLLKNTNSQTCKEYPIINNINCFNEIKIINIENKYYRAGHFATNSQGNMIIEYSFENYRLFYGIDTNGKLLYPNGAKEIEISNDTIASNVLNRYESVNIFASLVNDSNKEKEYLMSISSYITILELHDLENNDYRIAEATSFFEKNLGIYSFVFQILEAKIDNQIIYFCVYIFAEDFNFGVNTIVIKKFGLSNFDLETTITLGQTIIQSNKRNRITSSIIIDLYNLLSVIYMHEEDSYFHIKFFDFNLNPKGEIGNLFQYFSFAVTDGIFFKACYLYEIYIAFIYFKNDNECVFNVLSLTMLSEGNYNIEYSISDYEVSTDTGNLSSDISLNDFIKIDNDRLAFLTMNYDQSAFYRYLFVILFDLYNNCQKMGVRYYKFDINSETISMFSKEITAYIYNGYLVFSATVLPVTINTNRDNFFSIFMLFGYANGTDSEIEILPYLSDTENYNSTNILYNELIKYLKIDNNIFGYENAEQIKLISIPEEIQFFNSVDNSSIENDEIMDMNSKIRQKGNIIKTNSYYYLEYQFIVKEPDYSKFYSENTLYSRFYGENDLSTYYTPKTFYGRTNTLKFKLCHNYCNTCLRYGESNNEQKCETCSEEYSYNTLENSNSNCVPEGYYFDRESELIEQCNSENSKFYIDITNNKTICFKNNNECPNDYQDYDENTKECKYSKYQESTNIKTSFIKQTYKIEEITNKQKGTVMPINVETEINNYTSEDLLSNNSSKLNNTNEEIKKKIDNEILINYNSSGESIEIKGENNTIFQITSTDNEIKRFNGLFLNNNGLSVIDLGNCETLLKEYYNINNKTSLIIKKYEQITIASERNIQYEVYHPITKEKLNLSICDSEPIDIYIPVELNEKLLNLYEDLQNSGYDLFDIEDPFYNDLCSPYKSENGTDVLLSDRKNDYYNNNYTTCQSNCQYSAFNSEYKFLKCECKVIVDDIDINDFNKFSQKIYKNFYDILKNSNYKTLKCYKLVFDLNHLKKNIGSFVVITFFVGYLCFFIIYIIKGISPLKEEAIKTVCDKFVDINIIDVKKVLDDKNLEDNKNEKEDIKNFPPKKRKTVTAESGLALEKKENKKRKSSKLKKNKTINDKRKSKKENKISMIDEPKKDNFETKNNILEKTEKNKVKKRRKSKNKINEEVKDAQKLDDLDLNNLVYEKAIELDKRKFGQIYWNKLKTKHLFIYTFFSCYDYNLVYIKISRFLFLICTSMAMNVIFFFDSSMHKIYLDYGKYNFIQQVPQIIYSSIVSLIIEILIGILSYTDKNIYEIRQLKEYNPTQVKKILNSIKLKLTIYFVITFIFFAFYWYLISSFCAVYTNTQIIYLKDFATSFSLGLIYPFAIQLCFSFLRIFALKENTKSRSLLYKIC